MPTCKHCGETITRGPAPIYTKDPEYHRNTFYHVAQTREEAKALDEDHKPERDHE